MDDEGGMAASDLRRLGLDPGCEQLLASGAMTLSFVLIT